MSFSRRCPVGGGRTALAALLGPLGQQVLGTSVRLRLAYHPGDQRVELGHGASCIAAIGDVPVQVGFLLDMVDFA